MPPGTSRFCVNRAWRTSSTDRPKEARRSVLTMMLMARLRPPDKNTEPTPETVCSGSWIWCLAISVTSRTSRLPEITMVMIGEASRSNLLTTGGSMPCGKFLTMADTLSRTSWAATSPFFSNKNWTITVLTPSRVVERSSSMPETELTASSIGLVTVVSSSSALAPGRLAVTDTTGKSTLGNRSTPSLKYDTNPSTTGADTSTQVKIGRRMQTSDIVTGYFL